MSDTASTSIGDAVELFVHGAKTLHVGYYLDSRALERKALKIIGEATRTIDASSPTGRDPLLPLLDHQQEGVRTVAAAALYQSRPDRAIPVIEHVARFGVTEASGLAMKILMFHGRLNPCPSDPLYAGLHDDEDGVYRWEDPKFRERVMDGNGPNVFVRKSRPRDADDAAKA